MPPAIGTFRSRSLSFCSRSHQLKRQMPHQRRRWAGHAGMIATLDGLLVPTGILRKNLHVRTIRESVSSVVPCIICQYLDDGPRLLPAVPPLQLQQIHCFLPPPTHANPAQAIEQLNIQASKTMSDQRTDHVLQFGIELEMAARPKRTYVHFSIFLRGG